jgi:RNA polymerase sigma-70 factor (ECF subfamily)
MDQPASHPVSPLYLSPFVQGFSGLGSMTPQTYTFDHGLDNFYQTTYALNSEQRGPHVINAGTFTTSGRVVYPLYPIDRPSRFFCSILKEVRGLDREGTGGGMTTNEVATDAAQIPDRMERVVAQHAKFLSFLSARVEDRATAEDILQSAYLKAVEHGSEIRDDESTVAWFYRILRNAIIDHYRRRAARTSAQEAFAAEVPVSYEAEVTQTACACIGDVILGLKSEYRTAIERVDLAGMSVEAFAKSQDTSANNASVRLHRARRAVAKKLTTVCGACAEHKCLDCTCRRSQL